jgi:mevalonate kinase
MKAIAPGKVILSGEHAVLHGCPAVAMAIDRSAQAIVTRTDTENVSFDLQNYDYSESFTLRALRDIKQRISSNYHEFLEGEMGIRDVLHKPVDLFQYAFIMMMDGLHFTVEHGLDVQLFSNIPMGCGLGSSAASVLSEIRAVGHYFRVDFRPEWHYRYSLEAESMQHGKASGLDSYISLHGGCARFQNGEATRLPLPSGPLFLVHTGTPLTTTGECVIEVDREFAGSSIWDEFAEVTADFEIALIHNDVEGIKNAVRRNHRLLAKIGVVPSTICQFIEAVEAQGDAAKICGAGAIHGETAGMVMIIAKEPPVELCRQFGFEIMAVRGEPLGARIVG